MRISGRALFAGAAMFFLCGADSAQHPSAVYSARQKIPSDESPTMPSMMLVGRECKHNSLMLAEAAKLLMIPGRAQNKNDWMKFANELNEAGAEGI